LPVHRTIFEGRSRKHVVFSLILVAFTMVIIEVSAYLGLAIIDFIRPYRPVDWSQHHPYEKPDPNTASNWILSPGFRQTFRKELDWLKERSDAALGLIRKAGNDIGIEKDQVIFQINSAGFKGPEMNVHGKCLRILAIGDSCTFGTHFDYFSYPRSLDRSLCAAGVDAEVVNGGVEGYGCVNVLWRMAHFKAVKPDITLILLGWNVIYGDLEFKRFPLWTMGFVAKVARFARSKLRDPLEQAADLYAKPKHPVRASREVVHLESYVPERFVGQLAQIVTQMRSTGSRVVLMTLPGLFVMEEARPADQALKKGHLPHFTDNPYVLAKLTDRYNQAIRAAAQRFGTGLIDLDQWSRSALRPRHTYFRDSVHLTPRGQEAIGAFLAIRLQRLFPRAMNRYRIGREPLRPSAVGRTAASVADPSPHFKLLYCE